MSDEDAEILKAIKLLLRVSNKFQARALSLNTALHTIIQLSPNARASLKRDDVESLIRAARELADAQVRQHTAQLEQALENGKNFRLTLQAYASSLLRGE